MLRAYEEGARSGDVRRGVTEQQHGPAGRATDQGRTKR